MAIQGLRHTGTGSLATDERPKNWREGILMLFPNGKAPFFALTSMMKSQSTDDPQFYWWEKEIASQRVAIAADAAVGDTSITLAAGALELKLGDILYMEQHGELILVNADPPSDTSLPSVVRGYAGTTETELDLTDENPYLLKIGSCFEEGSDKPQTIGYVPTKLYSYTQIFRDNLSASRTAQKTRLRTRALVKEAKRETTHYHAAGIERAFIFGARSEGTRNGKPVRTTDGLINVLTREAGYAGAAADNVATLTGTTSYDELEPHLEYMFRYGSQEKLAFCGNRALRVLQNVIRRALGTSINLIVGQKEYGMDVSRLITPFGTLVLKSHPLFNQVLSGTASDTTTAYYGMDTWIMVLDFDNLKYRYVDDTFYKVDQQDNGLDGMESGFITECGLEIQHAKTHYLLKNLYEAATES